MQDLCSPTRDGTCVPPTLEVWTLNHWTSRKVASADIFFMTIGQCHSQEVDVGLVLLIRHSDVVIFNLYVCVCVCFHVASFLG